MRLHDGILEASEGLPGVKDEGALISALRAPVITAGGADAYHTLFDKVAALEFLVACNHPFSDANTHRFRRGRCCAEVERVLLHLDK